jgi:hypothetical protein
MAEARGGDSRGIAGSSVAERFAAELPSRSVPKRERRHQRVKPLGRNRVHPSQVKTARSNTPCQIARETPSHNGQNYASIMR